MSSRGDLHVGVGPLDIQTNKESEAKKKNKTCACVVHPDTQGLRERETDRQTYIQTDRLPDRQTDRQTLRQRVCVWGFP